MKINEYTMWSILFIVLGAIVITALTMEGGNKTHRPCKSIPISSIKAKGVVLKTDGSLLTIQTATDIVKESAPDFYQVIQDGDTIK